MSPVGRRGGGSSDGTRNPIEALLDDHFEAALELAGLPRFRLHNLRHSAATLLLGANVHPKLVQELLGHSSVAMTLDRYSNFIPSMGEQTRDAMQAALG